MAGDVLPKDIQTAYINSLVQTAKTIVFPDIRLYERISAESLLYQIQV